jgi:cell wall-associated NlpC family hydrolase
MDKWWFDNEDELAKLEKEMAEWAETPYMHHTGVKGRGCDCIHFIVKAMEPIGVFKNRAIIIPKYPRDWHLHNGEKLLVDGIRKQMNVEEVDREKPRNGDVVLYKYGLHEAHGGIYYNGHVVQALNNIGVTARQYEDPYFFERMVRCFRFKV